MYNIAVIKNARFRTSCFKRLLLLSTLINYKRLCSVYTTFVMTFTDFFDTPNKCNSKAAHLVFRYESVFQIIGEGALLFWKCAFRNRKRRTSFFETPPSKSRAADFVFLKCTLQNRELRTLIFHGNNAFRIAGTYRIILLTDRRKK